MSQNPPITFDPPRNRNLDGSLGINAINPLFYDFASTDLTIVPASAVSAGVVDTSNQSFAGTKTFNNVPQCATLPTTGTGLANKAYVDQLVTMSLAWQNPIISLTDVSQVVGPSNGDRYLQVGTVGSFINDYIYQWVASETLWDEFQPFEGWATHVTSDTSQYANSIILYVNTGTGLHWMSVSGTLIHNNLQGLTADDHLQYVKVAGRTGDVVTIPNTTVASSTTTGALQVTGGLSFER